MDESAWAGLTTKGLMKFLSLKWAWNKDLAEQEIVGFFLILNTAAIHCEPGLEHSALQ